MRIQSRLLLTLFMSAVLLLGVMFYVMQWSFDKGMLEYLNKKEAGKKEALITALANAYGEDMSWDFLRLRPRTLHYLVSQVNQLAGEDDSLNQPPPFERGKYPPPHHRAKKGERRGPPPTRRVAVLDKDKITLAGRYNEGMQLVPIIWQNEQVGWLAYPGLKQITDRRDLAFVERQTEIFGIVLMMVVVIAFLLAIPLARRLVKPITQITAATAHINRGHYDVDIPTSKVHELDQLGRDIKQLAATLKNNEQARRSWIADISHELRTPLAIVKGEVEAMVDGVREMSTSNLLSLNEEINHLQRLIEDLYQLVDADVGALRYQMDEVMLDELLTQVTQKHRDKLTQKGCALTLSISQKATSVWGDYDRLEQVIDNLLHNCFKYSDDDAQIHVTLLKQKHHLRVSVEDSGPGVREEERAKLFDYLYRTESSRNRKTGGSGLGLAICEKIIHAHNGSIEALPSSLGGLKMCITLPIKN
jgi:two-component system sensor histidine kinase BaeS